MLNIAAVCCQWGKGCFFRKPGKNIGFHIKSQGNLCFLAKSQENFRQKVRIGPTIEYLLFCSAFVMLYDEIGYDLIFENIPLIYRRSYTPSKLKNDLRISFGSIPEKLGLVHTKG